MSPSTTSSGGDREEEEEEEEEEDRLYRPTSAPLGDHADSDSDSDADSDYTSDSHPSSSSEDIDSELDEVAQLRADAASSVEHLRARGAARLRMYLGSPSGPDDAEPESSPTTAFSPSSSPHPSSSPPPSRKRPRASNPDTSGDGEVFVDVPVPPCAICEDRPVDHAAIPCGHTFCGVCVGRHREGTVDGAANATRAATRTMRGFRCPRCRRVAESAVRIYFA